MSFAQQIGSFSKRTQGKLHRIRRGVMLKLFNAVILDAPVDTGMLRGNWRYSERAPELTPIDRLDKAGVLAMAEVAAGVAASRGDADVYLCNNLPYASCAENGGWHGPTKLVLASGYSRKSPHGMVRKNVVRFAGLIQVEASKP